MVNSVGRKLQQARLARQLSVEEAARVTRIRPDKLIDLEEDNYSNFPSMSYAKGFLLLYARFLEVDVSDFAETLHTPNPVSSDDYEYLNAAATGAQPVLGHRPYQFTPRRQHTILPVVVFALLAGAVGLAIYLFVSFQRLGNLDQFSEKKDSGSPAPTAAAIPAEAAPVSTPAPAITVATPIPFASPTAPALRPPPPTLVAATPVPPASAVPVEPATAAAAAVAPAVRAATPSPAPVIATASPPPEAAPPPPEASPASTEASPAPAEPLSTPAPATAFDPTREVRRAEPVLPASPTHADAAPAAQGESPAVGGTGPAISSVVPMDTPAPDALRQVTILPVRKTWVIIRKDAADSVPIFEDYLYPGDSPLKLSGHKFWITVKDPSAVRITRDGEPLPGGQGDIEIE